MADYIWSLQKALGLTNWEVRLKQDEGPDDSDALAHIVPTYGRRVATLRLAPDLLHGVKNEDVRHTLVHELLHLALNDVTEVIRTDINAFGTLAQREYDGLWHYYQRQCELAVDHLALSFSQYVPSPPWQGGTGSGAERMLDVNEHFIASVAPESRVDHER